MELENRIVLLTNEIEKLHQQLNMKNQETDELRR